MLKPTTCASTLLHRAVDWHNGDIMRDSPEEYELFQDLIRAGLVRQLGGDVERRAAELTSDGICHCPVGGIRP